MGSVGLGLSRRDHLRGGFLHPPDELVDLVGGEWPFGLGGEALAAREAIGITRVEWREVVSPRGVPTLPVLRVEVGGRELPHVPPDVEGVGVVNAEDLRTDQGLVEPPDGPLALLEGAALRDMIRGLLCSRLIEVGFSEGGPRGGDLRARKIRERCTPRRPVPVHEGVPRDEEVPRRDVPEVGVDLRDVVRRELYGVLAPRGQIPADTHERRELLPGVARGEVPGDVHRLVGVDVSRHRWTQDPVRVGRVPGAELRRDGSGSRDEIRLLLAGRRRGGGEHPHQDHESSERRE